MGKYKNYQLIKRRAEPKPHSEPPSEWLGSLPEWCIYEALVRLGFKNRFTFQSPQLGGRLARGGAVVDFLIEGLNLAINVQSTFFHYRTTEQRTRGVMQKAQLESYGMKVIYIDEDAALRAPLWYTKEAIAGRDHSLMGRM